MAEGGEQLFGNILLGSRGGAVSLCRRPPPAARCRWLPRLGFHCCFELNLLPLPLSTRSYTDCAILQSQGSLKISPSGLVWKRSGGGRTVEVPADGECRLPLARPCQGSAQTGRGHSLHTIEVQMRLQVVGLQSCPPAEPPACLPLPFNRRTNRPPAARPSASAAVLAA